MRISDWSSDVCSSDLSFAYRPDHATMLQVGVYDGMSSFGRGLSSGLAALPTQFDSTRNPIDGSIDPCVFGQDGGGCLTPQLGSTTAIQYRNRGVQDRKSTRLNSSNQCASRMPSS